MSRYRNLTAAFLLAFGSRLIFYLVTRFTADDAYITYRYAENIAGGLGFVYNEGQQVLGTTTPLFTFILSLFAMVRIPVEFASLAIGLICSGLTAVVLYRFACSLRFTRWAYLPVLAYALWPRSLPADSCGMETALFTLFVTAAMFYQHKQLDIYAIGLATLATVTRPEGGLLLLLILLANWRTWPERWLAYLSVPAMILGPWLIFAQIYFGSVIPNSVPAKLALYSLWGTMPLKETFVYVMGWHSPFGWALLVAAGAGAVWLNRKQNYGWLPISWILSMVLFYTFSGSRIFFWYLAPIYPVYLLLGSAAVPYLIQQFGLLRQQESRWRPIVYAAAVIVLLIGSYKPLRYYQNYGTALRTMHLAVGQYLADNVASNDLIAAEDIGYMGYFSRGRILDRDGLISPEAIPYNRAGNYDSLIYDFSPGWVVASTDSPMSLFTHQEDFLSRYRLAQACSFGVSTYQIFRRK